MRVIYQQFSETDIINMFECLIDNIFVFFWWTWFPTWLLNKNEKKLARSFNFTFCYIDDVLSLNNTRFGDFVDRIYPIELEIKDNTDTGLLHILTYTSKLKVRAVKNEALRQKR
jgi:hypothetical protein